MATTARGYVAINLGFAPQTNKVLMTANRDIVISGENGASVSLKKGEKFYAVRSDSLGDGWFYIVRMVSGEKKCSCPAKKPCKHEIAVKAVAPVVAKPAAKKSQAPYRDLLKERAEDQAILGRLRHGIQEIKDRIAAESEYIPVSPSPALIEKLATLPEYCATSSLNGNRGFSLLK